MQSRTIWGRLAEWMVLDENDARAAVQAVGILAALLASPFIVGLMCLLLMGCAPGMDAKDGSDIAVGLGLLCIAAVALEGIARLMQAGVRGVRRARSPRRER